MSYQQFQQKCNDCSAEWNAAFGIVGTTIIAESPTKCPKCDSTNIQFLTWGWKMDEPKEECIHCWHPTGMVLTSNPPQDVQKCCHCGITRRYSAPLEIKADPGHGPYAVIMR